MKRGPGERQDTRAGEPEMPAAQLSPSEREHSDELFYTGRVVAEAVSACGDDALPMAIAAMRHEVEIAETFDGRERTRATCRYAASKVSQEAWPFNCDNLPFSKRPDPDVLAVEAELQAKRNAR